MPYGVYPHVKKHGHTPTGQKPSITYQTWINMISRCKYPSHGSYKYCGARGIRVCDRWKDFSLFLADMGERPSTKHSIDRIDNDGHYEPGNCRWATRAEQHRNMRQNVNVTIDGVTKCVTDWAREYGMVPSTIMARINVMGWDPVRAVTTPLQLNQWAAGKRSQA